MDDTQDAMGQEIAASLPELTPRQQAIIKALLVGNTRKAAAEFAGVHRDTLYEWIKTSPTFSDMVTRAEASAEVGHVACLAKAAQAGDWRASIEFLKRRRRDDWGDHVNFDLDNEISRLLAQVAGGGQAETA